jgi:hypothetical protein
MADELTNALAGLQFSPMDTGYGIGARGVAQALPTLVNPYANPLQNLGVTLGGALVASLLGYQAQKESFDMGLQTQQYANQMQALTTPQARTDFLAALPSEAISSGVGGRLSTLSRALAQQETLQKTAIGQEIAKQKALAEFELGPLGTQLFERKSQGEVLRQGAITNAFRERQEIEDTLLKGRALQRKQLGLEDVDVPQAIFNRAIERNASSDLALDVAKTIDTYKSIPEFAAAKNISAFGDDQLKSRLRNLATIVLQSRSGLAATDKERENLNKILTGDFTAVTPDTVSGILKRFAQDEKAIAADTVAAATQRPEAFVGELRQALQEGRQTQFGARVPEYGAPAAVTVKTPLDDAAKKTRAAQLRKEIDELKALLAQRN